MKIKKGDQVKILSGKDRGKQGNVLRCLPKNRKLVVEGVNVIKRHKKSSKRGQKGERISLPAPVDISNVQLICPKCGKASRVGLKIIENRRTRICKKCGKEI